VHIVANDSVSMALPSSDLHRSTGCAPLWGEGTDGGAWDFEMRAVCGVDEAGRGPLAGAVYAAAVILQQPIEGLADSKKLSARVRERLAAQIKIEAFAWCVASASVAEIDALNILNASMLAMERAVSGLAMRPSWVWVDGNFFPQGLKSMGYSGMPVIKGDSKVMQISAASILAKVARDADCLRMDAAYPLYGFAQHKGYPTRAHLDALQTYGITSEHRLSYAPVQRVVSERKK
jgi:ribonuclease HII